MKVTYANSTVTVCGDTPPPPLLNTSQVLTLRFRSNYAMFPGAGFLAVACCSLNITVLPAPGQSGLELPYI